MVNTTLPKPIDSIESQSLVLSEIYQLQLRMSSGKGPDLPTISEMANQLGITRTAIYDWVAGKFGSQRIAEYLSRLTGVSFPGKLDGPFVHATETLMKIRRRVIRYIM